MDGTGLFLLSDYQLNMLISVAIYDKVKKVLAKSKEAGIMEESVLYRYENKYIIDSIQQEELRMRMQAVCDTDFHVGHQGCYNIRSLYFDDYYDSSYMDNEIGVEPRSKWRFRIYDYNSDFIRLERKEKRYGKIRKETTAVTWEFCLSLLEDANKVEYPVENELVNRFLTEIYTRGLQPKVIVEYDRIPFVCEAGDVRITFDQGICFSDQVERFFERTLFLCPVLAVGQQLLEVKYTEFLPSFVHNLLDTGRLQQCTFSKYYLSRKIERNQMYEHIQ